MRDGIGSEIVRNVVVALFTSLTIIVAVIGVVCLLVFVVFKYITPDKIIKWLVG